MQRCLDPLEELVLVRCGLIDKAADGEGVAVLLPQGPQLHGMNR